MEFVSRGIRERYTCLALNLVRFSASDLEHIGRVGRHGAKLKNILLKGSKLFYELPFRPTLARHCVPCRGLGQFCVL